ncbi:MAG: sulfotransferase domain-containing protein [Chloroflexi bacterium]|nr:sulfotransferase domain-containing protein [Chloroflexota bacterium]
MDRDVITVVSGLPRSGTSMMMSMLDAGGLPSLTDNLRTADEDNPKGYYEFEQVKQIEHEWAWLVDARGKAVKIISELLMRLPADTSYRFKVIFMQRHMAEILASQRQMLIRRGEPADAVSDAQLTLLFTKHLKRFGVWAERQPNLEILYVSYNAMLENPREYAEQVNRFVGGGLDVEKMIAVVDKALYRQRK